MTLPRFFLGAGLTLAGLILGELIEPFASVRGAGHAIAAAGVLAGFMLGRCRHPYFALIPATRDAAGLEIPAFWRCPDCARTRPYDLTRVGSHVVTVRGFDESKARLSAERAELLERRRRAAAVARAFGEPQIKAHEPE